MSKHITTCLLGDYVSLEVHYTFTPGLKSSDYYTPPEQPDIDIDEVICGGVDIISLLSEKQIQNLQNQIEDRT